MLLRESRTAALEPPVTDTGVMRSRIDSHRDVEDFTVARRGILPFADGVREHRRLSFLLRSLDRASLLIHVRERGYGSEIRLDPIALQQAGGSTRVELNTIPRETAESIGRNSWRDGMSSLVAEQREPRAQGVTVSEESLTVDLADGRTIIVPLVWYPRFCTGKAEERNHFEIFGDGTYIHWPDLDEDLTVAASGRSSLGGESEVLRRLLKQRGQKRRKSKRYDSLVKYWRRDDEQLTPGGKS